VPSSTTIRGIGGNARAVTSRARIGRSGRLIQSVYTPLPAGTSHFVLEHAVSDVSGRSVRLRSFAEALECHSRAVFVMTVGLAILAAALLFVANRVSTGSGRPGGYV
jgi:hypothetical protein